MKAKLRLPLRSTIRDGFDEGDVMRVWRAIGARRRPSRRRVGWLVAGLVTVSAATLWFVFPRFVAQDRAGPLRLASAEVPGRLQAEQEEQRLALADGSVLVARPHTKVDVLANDARLFQTALRQGAVHVEVRPGGPRRWVLECGPVTVEVVGTEFEVERSAGQVLVSVVRGVVVVRGERVPDHVQRLTAGERLAVPTGPGLAPASAATAATGATERVAATEPALAPSMSPEHAVGAAAKWTSSPRKSAVATVSPRADGDELIGRADAARRSGNRTLAKQLLAQALETSQGRPAGAVAALTLARLTMDDEPARAARVLASALGAGIPHGLEEDIRARLVEARARSGDGEGARQAAREYRQRFPEGARADEVRHWVAE